MGNCDRVELLAPAGNTEGFYGAIHAGADAVYLGGNRFGARAYAENFTSEELVKCIRYAHLVGRRVYLTVNTLLKERETEELEGYLRPFYEAGLDAVIVQDLGVLRLVRERFPGLRIHASTQMTLCSPQGILLLKEMGASRVVPARELSLEEILLLKGHRAARGSGGGEPQSWPQEASGTELECFIHGAMCYCYSGQCLFSSILGGRSGNRGRCAQPCRLPYRLKTEGRKPEGLPEECHPLSLKDMCTIGHIPLLVEAGIDSFKIEGRMKKPEYAAGVTEVYRRYIDRYYELRERKGAEEAARAYQVEGGDWKRLHSLYIRSQVQDGYYFRRNGRDMVTLDNPAYSGSDEALLTEIREKYIAAPLKLPVEVRAEFRIGEPARLTLSAAGGTAGISCISHTVTGETVGRAKSRPITKEDVAARLDRLGDSTFYAQEMYLSVEEGCFYPMGQINELRRAAAAGLEEKLLRAEGHGPTEEKTIEEKLADPRGHIAEKGRTAAPGGYGGSFAVSVRTLGQLEALAAWLDGNPGCGPGRVYVDADLLVLKREETLTLCKRLRGVKGKGVRAAGDTSRAGDACAPWDISKAGDACAPWELYAALPYILRAGDQGYLEDICGCASESGLFSGFLVRSLDGLGYLWEKRQGKKGCAGKRAKDSIGDGSESAAVRGIRDCSGSAAVRGVRGGSESDSDRDDGERMIIRTDAGVYVWNRHAGEELASLAEGFCLPYELNAGEQRVLLDAVKNNIYRGGSGYLPSGEGLWEKIVYGRIPMMLTANCLLQTAGRCRGKGGPRGTGDPGPSRTVLQDRYRKEFPVAANCLHCMNIIYNSVPLSLWKELPKWKGRVDLRIDFTLEAPEEMGQILDSFLMGAALRQGEHTLGHERRGVE